MFAKIMAVVMAAILVTTIGLSAVWWITLRNQQIETRLESLISEAEDIASLVEDMSGTWTYSYWGQSAYRIVLNQKAEKINREVGA